MNAVTSVARRAAFGTGIATLLLSLFACAGQPTDSQQLTEIHVFPGLSQQRPVSVRRQSVVEPPGDARIYEGRYILAADGPEFRACNLDEKYLVDASFSVEDTLDYFIQSQPMIQAQVYIRFHGEATEGTDGLPEHYAGVVRINELLAYSAAVPTPCN